METTTTLDDMTIETAMVELIEVEATAQKARAELYAAQGRAGELRKYLTAALYEQAIKLQSSARMIDRPRRGQQLTPREQQVAHAYAASDLSVKDLARQRHVTMNTLKSQLKSAYRKLGVEDRDQLRQALLGAIRPTSKFEREAKEAAIADAAARYAAPEQPEGSEEWIA